MQVALASSAPVSILALGTFGVGEIVDARSGRSGALGLASLIGVNYGEYDLE